MVKLSAPEGTIFETLYNSIMTKYRFALLLVLVTFLTACGDGGSGNSASSETAAPTPAPTASPQRSLPKIVAFGDSLTSGLGLPAPESYPSRLQKLLEADGYQYEIVNAGVSGDTTAGGLRRIDWALEGDVRFLILALGANDLLRGLPVKEMKNNLGQIVERARARKIEVLLAGMYAPTNAGAEYRREVEEAFRSLAKEQKVIFIPFLLDRVGGIESLNQPDGIHPNAEGARIVAETIYKELRPLLEKQKQEGRRAQSSQFPAPGYGDQPVGLDLETEGNREIVRGRRVFAPEALFLTEQLAQSVVMTNYPLPAVRISSGNIGATMDPARKTRPRRRPHSR
jgi:acyl-CoA thioesterase I